MKVDKRNILWRSMIIILLLVTVSCSSESGTSITRKSQDEIHVLPPPVFNSIDWPAPYTELTDEGRLVITGNLQCPAGYFTDVTLALYIFPTGLIDPPLPVLINPPPTYIELEQILLANPKVQVWMSWLREWLFRTVTEGPYLPDEFLKGSHCYGISQFGFNEYNYVDFETGDFRIDLDEWARLSSGRKLLTLWGIDQAGQTTVKMNILDVPVLFPDLLDDLNADSMEYGDRMTTLASALFEVLAASGDGRGADIALMVPFFNLAENAYSDGYNVFDWDTSISEFKDEANDAALLIGNPVYRQAYLTRVDDIEYIFDLTTRDAWSHHYTLLEGLGSPLDQYQDGHSITHEMYFKITEQWDLIERGGGVKELTILVYEDEDLIAQFSVIGDPSAPLTVTGFIGERPIIPNDYNPYFLEIFGVFHDERIFWPPYGM